MGVNCFPPAGDVPLDVMKVDNTAVRATQIDKLERLRRERDEQPLSEALGALTTAARTGRGNLLALAVEAARARGTVGEISYALEEAWGRHEVKVEVVAGVTTKDHPNSTRCCPASVVSFAISRTTKGDRPRSSSLKSARMATIEDKR